MSDEAEARAFLLELGVAPDVVDATPERDWYLLVEEQLFFGGRPTLTARDVGERVGLDEDVVRRLWVILGFPDPVIGPDFREDDLPLFRMYQEGAAVFGPEPVQHFTRVLGAAARTVSDAMSSLWLDVLGETRASATPLAHLELSQLGGSMAARIPDEILRPLFLRHALDAQVFSAEAGAYASSEMDVAIGFCDLVGSTSLHNAVAANVIGRALVDFEAASHEAAVRHGGRVVKLIGDEVMFASVDIGAAEKIAAEIVAWVGGNRVLVGARAGIARGTVVARGGDLYGPTVNLAARLAGDAETGTIVVADADATRSVEVRGFAEPVRVRTIAV